jgi:hypothetical protein
LIHGGVSKIFSCEGLLGSNCKAANYAPEPIGEKGDRLWLSFLLYGSIE